MVPFTGVHLDTLYHLEGSIEVLPNQDTKVRPCILPCRVDVCSGWLKMNLLRAGLPRKDLPGTFGVGLFLCSNDEVKKRDSSAPTEEGSQGGALHLLFQKFPSWLKPRSKPLCLLLLPVLGAFIQG